jgi:hypothetical protein
MPWVPAHQRFGAEPPVNSYPLSDFSGTYTFTVTDVDGIVNTVMGTSHQLTNPEELSFPTHLQISNNSTTPTFSFTDPNSAPPSGETRAYGIQIYAAGEEPNGLVYSSKILTGPSSTVPSGILTAGDSYDFEARIIDANSTELTAFQNQTSTHNPEDANSRSWAFGFTPLYVAPVPEPTTLLLLGSGLIGLAGYGRKKFFKK